VARNSHQEQEFIKNIKRCIKLIQKIDFLVTLQTKATKRCLEI